MQKDPELFVIIRSTHWHDRLFLRGHKSWVFNLSQADTFTSRMLAETVLRRYIKNSTIPVPNISVQSVAEIRKAIDGENKKLW